MNETIKIWLEKLYKAEIEEAKGTISNEHLCELGYDGEVILDMRTIYIADDGTQFDDYISCEDYEWKMSHPYLKDIHIFDNDGNEFENVLSEDAYNYSAKIVVTSNEAVNDLQDLAKYTGYCCYRQINNVGEWIFDEHEEQFIMV